MTLRYTVAAAFLLAGALLALSAAATEPTVTTVTCEDGDAKDPRAAPIASSSGDCTRTVTPDAEQRRHVAGLGVGCALIGVAIVLLDAYRGRMRG
ncbi:hypothetical protein [Halegenticoccus soli]|uniref:hypothetical protein n=1 Tax=Halegenticoccus soli TaxID=1985678 RepID=UPI000C6D6455|nr:hypothetical protein [Halegenticoccus soli]